MVEEGDTISIDAEKNEINLHVSEETLAIRKKNWNKPKEELEGVLGKYSKMVTSASKGAVTN